MINRFFIVFGMCLMLNTSCQENSNTGEGLDLKGTNEELKKAINFGDFEAYNKVSNFYIINDMWPDLYYYSQLMANKYNCPEAHFQLYKFLTDKVNVDGINMYSDDLMTTKTSLYHLLKSYEGGFAMSKEVVDDLYGGRKVPKSRDIFKEY